GGWRTLDGAWEAAWKWRCMRVGLARRLARGRGVTSVQQPMSHRTTGGCRAAPFHCPRVALAAAQRRAASGGSLRRLLRLAPLALVCAALAACGGPAFDESGADGLDQGALRVRVMAGNL